MRWRKLGYWIEKGNKNYNLFILKVTEKEKNKIKTRSEITFHFFYFFIFRVRACTRCILLSFTRNGPNPWSWLKNVVRQRWAHTRTHIICIKTDRVKWTGKGRGAPSPAVRRRKIINELFYSNHPLYRCIAAWEILLITEVWTVKIILPKWVRRGRTVFVGRTLMFDKKF